MGEYGMECGSEKGYDQNTMHEMQNNTSVLKE